MTTLRPRIMHPYAPCLTIARPAGSRSHFSSKIHPHPRRQPRRKFFLQNFRAISLGNFQGNNSSRPVYNMANLKIQTIDLGDKTPSIIAAQEQAIQEATQHIREELKQLPGEPIVEWHKRLENHPIVFARRESERREYAEHWRREGPELPGASDNRDTWQY